MRDLKFNTTVTNGNDKLYNKTIVDYLGIGYGVDIHYRLGQYW